MNVALGIPDRRVAVTSVGGPCFAHHFELLALGLIVLQHAVVVEQVAALLYRHVVRVVVLLDLFRDARSSHEAFFVGILLLVLVLTGLY